MPSKRKPSYQWLFVRSYTLSIDGEKQSLKSKEKIFRDNGFGSIWEWQTIAVDDDLRKTLEAIVKSKRTILRYLGSDFRKDRDITKEEKVLIKIMLLTFDAKVALHDE